MLQAAKLWARRSARGTDYFSGRLGGVKIVILPNRDFAEGDPSNSHSHVLFFADGTPANPGGAPAQPQPAVPRRRARLRGPKQQISDDIMPF
jgi:hypothetical protein